MDGGNQESTGQRQPLYIFRNRRRVRFRSLSLPKLPVANPAWAVTVPHAHLFSGTTRYPHWHSANQPVCTSIPHAHSQFLKTSPAAVARPAGLSPRQVIRGIQPRLAPARDRKACIERWACHAEVAPNENRDPREFSGRTVCASVCRCCLVLPVSRATWRCAYLSLAVPL